MSRWALIALGCAAYLGTLAATLPADRALPYVLPMLESRGLNVEVGRPSGSVWSGAIDGLSIGPQRLERVQWELHPVALLAARLGASWQVQTAGGHLQGRLSADTGNRIEITDVEGRLPIDVITARLPLPVALGGEVALNLERFVLADGGPESAEGAIVLSRARVVSPQQVELGDLKLELSPLQGGGIKADLSDAGGPLELDGTVTLEGSRRYRLDAVVSPRMDADPILNDVLPVIARRTADGKYRLEFTGTL